MFRYVNKMYFEKTDQGDDKYVFRNKRLEKKLR